MQKNCLRSNKCLILRYLGISKSFKFCKIEIYFGNIRQLVHRLLICNYIFFASDSILQMGWGHQASNATSTLSKNVIHLFSFDLEIVKEKHN